MNKPIFSIVIPTLNEEKYLPRLLEDLSKQTFPKELFEVIHVDGSSEDNTVAKANIFLKELNLKSIQVKKRNVAFQRNTGAEYATGEWVIFMDADDQLPAYFLDGIKYKIAREKKIDVFTTWSVVKKNDPVSSSINRMLNLGLEVYNSTGKPAAMGAMIGIKRKIMNEIQFDEKQKFMEDTLFVQEVCEAGNKLVVFREPRYILSLRRYEKEGTLKSIGTGALLQLKFLQGKDFQDEDRYKMDGGSYYDQISPSLFKNIFTQIRKMPSKQIQSTRKILNSISKELGM